MPVKKSALRVRLPIPAPADRRRFPQRLLTWYGRHGRDLPWRKTDDPYHILVSEIMLQQTQVDRVLPKYAEWLDKYPSMEVLARRRDRTSPERGTRSATTSGPKRLQSIARESVRKYGGRLPSTRRRCGRSRDRRLHRRRDPQLRVPRARRDSRHQRRARAVPRLRRQGRSEEPCDEAALWTLSKR
jgi:hypothetical protein